MMKMKMMCIEDDVHKCHFLPRSANWAGVTQYVDVAPHTNYYFSAHVKLLNQQKMWTKVELFAEVKYHASRYHVPMLSHLQNNEFNDFMYYS